jgi:hypothetical protein
VLVDSCFTVYITVAINNANVAQRNPKVTQSGHSSMQYTNKRHHIMPVPKTAATRQNTTSQVNRNSSIHFASLNARGARGTAVGHDCVFTRPHFPRPLPAGPASPETDRRFVEDRWRVSPRLLSRGFRPDSHGHTTSQVSLLKLTVLEPDHTRQYLQSLDDGPGSYPVAIGFNPWYSWVPLSFAPSNTTKLTRL